MDTATVSLILAATALALSVVALVLKNRQAAATPASPTGFETIPLQLQAYERLVVLCERIALPSLISRVSQPDLSAREMQAFLIENIKQEFEYNASQQVYVSPVAWEAVRNLKDQNMLVINQLAAVLPAEARARDLNRKLLEVVMEGQEKPLHAAVLETLNFEARKLLKPAR